MATGVSTSTAKTASTEPPKRVTSVRSVRRGSSACSTAGSNSAERATTSPGRTRALMPLVVDTTVDRPCSTARSRAMASC